MHIIFKSEGCLMKKQKRGIVKYIILIAVFALVLAALVLFFNTRSSVSYERPVKPVAVMKPEMRTIRDTIELNGYIEAEAMIPVVPFVSGTIESYPVKAGDIVSEGDVIAEIDKEPYELQKAQAEAAYLGLSSSFDRVDALYQKGAATKQDRDMLKAQLDATKAQLDLAELQLSYATVTSSVSGTVLMAPSAVGSIASSESPLAVIADLSDLIVTVRIGERYFSRINDLSDSIVVEVSTPQGLMSSAEIISIAPFVDPVSKTFEMKVRLLSPTGFVPGMFARITLVLSENECYALPSYASQTGGALYRLSSDSTTAEYVEIESGLSDGEYFAVPEGYADSLFIVRGLDGLVSGMPVSVVEGAQM